ncbi:DUF5363 domain-containing protein [Mannheimia haemolytica]|uniref:DUF5363 domain-containing protein n=1 Tax=Mannheimia haemolytica TaxID=75985 RepID=UPI000B2F1295
MSEQTEKKGWFKKALEKYDAFCDELGVNQGACRGCVPVVKFDPEPEKSSQKNQKIKHRKNAQW